MFSKENNVFLACVSLLSVAGVGFFLYTNNDVEGRKDKRKSKKQTNDLFGFSNEESDDEENKVDDDVSVSSSEESELSESESESESEPELDTKPKKNKRGKKKK